MPKVGPVGEIPFEVLAALTARRLQPTERWTDLWRQQHQLAFSVAGVTETRILEGLHNSLTEALQFGLSFKQWRLSLSEDFVAALRHNSGRAWSEREFYTVYDTNLRMARSAGQWDRIQRQKKALPFLRYALGPSRVHRDDHVALEGLILPVDDEFWRTHMPPNGFNCRCRVVQMTRAGARNAPAYRGGLDPDNLPTVIWRDPRVPSGYLRLPFGVEPGFNYNPGIGGQHARELREAIAQGGLGAKKAKARAARQIARAKRREARQAESDRAAVERAEALLAEVEREVKRAERGVREKAD